MFFSSYKEDHINKLHPSAAAAALLSNFRTQFRTRVVNDALKVAILLKIHKN